MEKFSVFLLMFAFSALSWSADLYEVTHISRESQGKIRNLCLTKEPDFRCGQKVTLLKNPSSDQLLFLENSPSPAGIKTFDPFHGALFQKNKKCWERGPVSILNAPFESNLCRAALNKGAKNSDFDVYIFMPNMAPRGAFEEADPFAQAIVNAILVGGLTGVPIGFGTLDTVYVPKTQWPPEEIRIEQLRVGVAFFARVDFVTTFALRRLH